MKIMKISYACLFISMMSGAGIVNAEPVTDVLIEESAMCAAFFGIVSVFYANKGNEEDARVYGDAGKTAILDAAHYARLRARSDSEAADYALSKYDVHSKRMQKELHDDNENIDEFLGKYRATCNLKIYGK